MGEIALHKQSLKKRLAFNYLVLSGGESLAKVLGFLSFAFLARVLGPQTYGHLEFALAATFFFGLIVDCGLSTFAARQVAQDKDAALRLVAHVIALRALLSVAAFAVLAILVGLMDKPWPIKRLVLLYGITLFELPAMLNWLFQGLDEMHFVALASIVRWVIFAAVTLLLVRGPDQVWIMPLIESIAIGTALLLYVGVVFRRYRGQTVRLDLDYALDTLRQAIPIGASEMVWAVKMYAATLLLALLTNGSEVGWFAAGHRIVVSLHTFVWLYFFNLLPSLSRCVTESVDNLLDLARSSLVVTTWVGVFIGVFGTFLAKPLMAPLYGTQYMQSVDVLQVLVWLIPLTLLNGHYRYALIAYGRQSLELLSQVCGTALNCALVLLLVPRVGPVGGAWALVTSEILIFVVAYILARRKIATIRWWPCAWRPLLAGGVLAAVLVLVGPWGVWLASGLAVMVYSAALLLLQPGLPGELSAILSERRR